MTTLRLLALTIALAAPVAAQTAPTQAAPPATVAGAAALPDGQVSIAVGIFKCKAAKCYSDLGDGVADALTTALLNTGKFTVYERENTTQLTEEVFFQGGTAFEGAELLIFGSITQYEPEASGGGLSFMGLSIGQKSSSIGMDIRIVDAKTRRIIGATQVQGSVSGNSFSMVGLLPVNIGAKTSPQIEAAITQMLNNAVKDLLLKIPSSYYKVQ
ncbi:CsgG/HfaB family protein [Deinococcus aquaedulcis]|uniref:CsgG/HfaB family protein n=1 Tax=Deinococcus aquaedulcis TaxID=2840455 RepID=UPI001C830DA7|nr:CsgG/HfaB family protein [Deinococcus aquaedulcis]